MADKSGKTEQPTQQRLKKAREQGQFPAAKEFVAALQFMVFLTLLGSGGAGWFGQFRQTTRSILRLAFAPELRPETLIHLAWQTFWQNILPLAMAAAGVAIVTVAFRLVTTQFGISFKKLMPDATRFNPMARLQDLPKQNLPSLVQAILLLPIFLWAVWVVARDKLDLFLALPMHSVESGFSLISSSLMELFWKAASVFLIFGCVDLARQLQKHKSDLRMSKQEIREEMKDVEGNPQMKARIRRLQRDRNRCCSQPDALRRSHPLSHGQYGGAPRGSQRQELPRTAHTAEGDRAPGPDYRESAARASSLQIGRSRTGNSASPLPRGGRNSGLHLQAHERKDAGIA
jgi:flagellar biosynthetic protein FlhB